MILTKWLNKSLRTKMLTMFVFLTIIPLIVVSLISYQKYSNIILEREYNLADIKTVHLTREIDLLFQDFYRFTEISRLEITKNFLVNDQHTTAESNEIQEVFDFYRSSYLAGNHIFDLQIMNTEGKTISDQRGIYHRGEVAKKLLKESWQNTPKRKIELVKKNGFPALDIIKPIFNNDNSHIGWIQITIDTSAITDIINNNLLGDNSGYTILSSNNTILFQSKNLKDISPDFNSESLFELESGNLITENSFYNFNTSQLTNFKIVGVADLDEINKNTAEIKTLILITVISSISFVIGLYFFISNKLILPIRLLRDKMQQASQGDLYAKVNPHGEDEVATLGDSFNRMIIKIRTLMDRSVEEQKKLKAAEFRSMQAQINPHFLYNTLDTIVWMAESKEHKQVIEITKALSQFCRVSLSKGKDWISIEEEVSHIASYLFIQKIRYEDILDVSLEINKDIYSFQIIKLLLQPIIENAIYHGIKNKRGKGFLRIKGNFDSNNMIYFEIIDNGIGMTEDRLTYLKEQLRKGEVLDDAKSGFGLVNVQQRLKLYYGESFGLKVNSWYKSGTRVSITIPRRR
ncbi:sensor histidine kinase [Saliterribacillus persicus]|uniref:Two-component system sensor histidine kinase YesM n=1 Tax=Saliterribacillus persicus TaxID=930114 RepID=A0A368Y9F8_9BACI|nr:sensor histidine kinase [Saliterribacillus persicus]RCW74824.1 two-component system sensor histidine kinase YesM [Saliterribacillus persicus]